MTIKNMFPGAENTLVDVGGGLTHKGTAFSDNVMCAEVHLEAGTEAPLHHRRHEQITYDTWGKFAFTVGDKTDTVGAGGLLYKQPNIVHGPTCIAVGLLLDVFTPPREDFL